VCGKDIILSTLFSKDDKSIVHELEKRGLDSPTPVAISFLFFAPSTFPLVHEVGE